MSKSEVEEQYNKQWVQEESLNFAISEQDNRLLKLHNTLTSVLFIEMARSLKELNGWEIILTDENGNIVEIEGRRRSRRGKDIVKPVLKRTSDGLTLTVGDSIRVRNKKSKDMNDSDATTVHFINDIRLNTLNNLVEIWVFDYLQWFDIDPKNYYKELNKKVIELNESDDFYQNMFENETNKNELYLTIEPSEIILKNFISKVNIVPDLTGIKDKMGDFVVRYICEAHAKFFIEIDLVREIENIKKLTSFKEIDSYFKSLLYPEVEIINEAVVPKKKSVKFKSTKKTIIKVEEEEEEEKEQSDLNDLESDDVLESDISSSEEFKVEEDDSINDDDENDDLENVESEGEDPDIDEDKSEEEESDDIYNDKSNKSTKGIRKRGRPRSLTPKPKYVPKKKKEKKNKSIAATSYYRDVGIRKFTKKNIARAKKKYTAFSKRYSSIKSIPDLTKTPGFYQQSNEDVFNQLESMLETKQNHKVLETIFSKVKKQLYSSHGKEMVIKSKDFGDLLPARENEFASIYLSLYSAIEAGTATTLYIAGTPGVGKTLTVREVMKEIQNSAVNEELPPFLYVEINGLKMVKPTDSYEFLWNKISGERLTWGASMESLEFYFEKVPKEKKRTVVLLLDELDALVTKGQDIMYNFFNWTTYENAKIIVIAVANTMDLPERQLGNKISSRIGFTRIMFSGYNHDELKNIIDLRLKGLNDSYFYVDIKTGSAFVANKDDEIPDGMKRVQLKMSSDAIEIASRKVASVSGDARRALKVCKRAAEIAEQYYMARHGYGYDGKITVDADEQDEKDSDEVQTVHINHIMKALNETINSNSINFIENLSFTSKLFLYSFLNLIKKTGVQEQLLGDIVDEIKTLVDVNGNNRYINSITQTLFHRKMEENYEQLRIISWNFVINQLVEAGLLIKQNMKNERIVAVKLNIALEDMKQAINQDETLKTL